MTGSARLFDPDTSVAAAASMDAATLARQQARVLAVIATYPWPGATRDEVAERLNADRSCVSRRITDLCELGLAQDSGKRRVARSGRKQIAWCLTARGYEKRPH